MKALKFKLKGKTAFFKKPEVNTYLYFSYGNIHKIALLGILGSILGLTGYSFQKDKDYPEFYEELNDLKVSIVPLCEKGVFLRKSQVFNNSVGYASQEEGGNLIVKELWLENPEWDIYLMIEGYKYEEELQERLINKRFVYIPYLGKNDHYANIENVEIVDLEEVKDACKIDSLFIKKYFEFMEEDIFSILDGDSEDKWKYEERLPIALEKVANQYIIDNFILTNMKVKLSEKFSLYKDNQRILFFF